MEPQIFQFNDFSGFLRAYLAYRQQDRAWFSVRRLTKVSGLASPAQISMLINRKRAPSLPLVERIARGLGLTEDEVRYAVLLAEKELARSPVLVELVNRELSAIAQTLEARPG